MSNDTLVRKTFMIEERQIDIVREFADEMSYRGESAAIRRIIDEWHQLKSRVLVDSPVAYTVNTSR